MHNKETARTYQKLKHILFFVGLAIDVGVLLFFFFSGLSFGLRDYAGVLSSNIFVINAIYLLVLSFGFYIIHFPLNMFIGFSWEHKFNLSNQSFGQWFWDDLKKSFLGFLFILILVESIYIFLGKFPDHWWVFAASFWLFLTFVLAKLTPNVIIPLFYQYLPIDKHDLKQKVFELFRNCKVALKDVYAINFSAKTKKANAFVCGIGKNRRVVLSDTLIEEFSVPEIEVVLAHELGHYKHKDIMKLLVANAIVIFLGLYLVHHFILLLVEKLDMAYIDDISFLPIITLIFIMFTLIISPILNGYSRHLERRADQYSLETTKDKKSFISLMQKLGEINLSEFEPNRFIEWFFYDHPPIQKRIEFAKVFKGS